jgi:diguanylate cyclase (GGDEF)-like protein/PAS domain S-box-containing protein
MLTFDPSVNSSQIDLSDALAAAMEYVHSTDPLNKSRLAEPFIDALLDCLRDGIIVVDLNRTISVWNQTTELMTDLAGYRMIGHRLTPQLLAMRDSEGNELLIEDWPLEQCLRTKKPVHGNFRISGRSGRELKVEASFTPVFSPDGNLLGGVVILNDSSLQTHLTRQIKELSESSIVDPLTHVHNRAEFERVLSQFVKARNGSDFKCSLIVCDIDFFKSINDNFNHHIGDQCLVAFAGILKQFVRGDDLIARYGGEEFVILCGNCDLAFATERAEEIRLTLTRTAMSMLGGKCLTASFGVAELGLGETATDFFVRADSALLNAKTQGRNKVVKSGSTGDALPSAPGLDRRAVSQAGLIWKNLGPDNPLILEEFATTTPVSMLVEKLRGYLRENNAKIIDVAADYAKFQIDVEDARSRNQKGIFIIEMEIQEGPTESFPENDRRRRTTPRKNFIRIAISEGKRKWFAHNCNELAVVAMRDLRRFFMISEATAKLGIERAVTKSTRDKK